MSRRSGLQIAMSWLGTFASARALWLVLAGTLARDEVLAGAGVAALAATVSGLVAVSRPVPRPVAADAAALGRALASVPADLFRLVRVLVRELRGEDSEGGFEVVVLHGTAGDDGRAAARRSLGPVAVSLSPNRYVVAVDEDAGEMLVHRLTRGAGESGL